MRSADLIELVKDPSGLRPSHVAELRQLAGDFPWFQSAQVLLCLATRLYEPALYQQQLKRAAIVCSDRSRLYELVRQAEARMGQTEKPEEAPAAPAKQLDPALEEELRILDAAVGVSDPVAEQNREAAIKAEREKEAGQLMELEILKQAVVAVVDKEIIRADEQAIPEAPAPEAQTPIGAGSFSDWLKQLRSLEQAQPDRPDAHKKPEPEPREKALPKPAAQSASAGDSALERKRKQQAIIDRIIEKSPGAIRPKEEQKFFTPERKAKESLLENEHLVTETLAKIYAMQGNVAKAIRSYEILSLKYPQKSAYFASLIQKLKQNQ